MHAGLTRTQIVVYASLGLVMLLLGIRALRGSDPPDPGQGGFELAGEPVGPRREGSGDLVVHVAGAVAEPGVFRLAAGARVADAIERAGGPSRRAAPDGINLAARLADGQQVVVPVRSADGAGRVAAAADGPISLGSAEQADLEDLDGVGPVTAEKIIEFRDQRGGIGAIEELDEIPGIGPATVASLSDQLQP